MYYTNSRITFTEVPNEISLTFLISGCPLKCTGCHSTYAKDPTVGTYLSIDEIDYHIKRHNGFITTVCFLGGEWEPQELSQLLQHVKFRDLKTALYSGKTKIPTALTYHLDYIKLGPWVERLGGLDSETTNQRFINLNTNEDITHLFQNK